MTDLAALTAPPALAAPDWCARVQAALPATLQPPEGEEGWEEDGDPRERLDEVCEEVLAHPDAIAHPDWGVLLRAVVALCCDYRALTDDVYGEALDPELADEDEGGVVEMISELRLATIGDALELLAHPAAVARADWAALVRHALEEKQARLGTGAFLCPGADEADELFAAPHVRAHPEAPALWRLADEILPLEGEAP